ncbi:MAG: ABC transporter permease [Chloroflexi bacterium]|nr:ABC transporter permease [Chloroflexota bacterium]
MTEYYIRRALFIIPTLFLVSLVTFIIMHATPGGPWDTDPGSRTSDPRVAERLNKAYGLDKPLYFNPESAQRAIAEGKEPLAIAQAFMDSQFNQFLANLAQGKFGPSFRYRGREVEDIIFEAQSGKPFWQNRFVATAALGVVALVIAVAIGFPLGVIAALKQNTWWDTFSLFFATVFYGIPNFVLAIFLILIFGAGLGWIKIVEIDYWDNLRPWILPSFVLAIPTAAFLARLTRSSVLEVMRMDYVRTARAKGLAERVVVIKHILKNSMIPVVTFLGPALAGLITGSFIIETQFGVTGIGRLFVESISRRDYSLIMALTLIYAFFIAFANFAVDVIYGFLDPRIRMGRG